MGTGEVCSQMFLLQLCRVAALPADRFDQKVMTAHDCQKTPVAEWQIGFGSALFPTSLPPGFLSHPSPSRGVGLTRSEGKK